MIKRPTHENPDALDVSLPSPVECRRRAEELRKQAQALLDAAAQAEDLRVEARTLLTQAAVLERVADLQEEANKAAAPSAAPLRGNRASRIGASMLRIQHPFPLWLHSIGSSVSRWARENNVSTSRAWSWYADPPNEGQTDRRRPIPRHYADQIAQESKDAVPLSCWWRIAE